MSEYELSGHAIDMLKERNIPEGWMRLTLEEPEWTETMDDGTVHYIRSIEQHGERYLRVVVNPAATPPRIVTLFFDRRITGLI